MDASLAHDLLDFLRKAHDNEPTETVAIGLHDRLTRSQHVGAGLSQASLPLSACEGVRPATDVLTAGDWSSAWNAMASACGLPRCTLWPPRRAAQARQRCGEYTGDQFTRALAAIPRSAFLRGSNPRNWRANIDWFLRPRTIARILEGHYAGTGAREMLSDEKEAGDVGSGSW